MKKRHRIILDALHELDGKATAREIAETAGLPINGVAQSISQSLVPRGLVRSFGKRKGEKVWRLID